MDDAELVALALGDIRVSETLRSFSTRVFKAISELNLRGQVVDSQLLTMSVFRARYMKEVECMVTSRALKDAVADHLMGEETPHSVMKEAVLLTLI